MNWKTSKDAKKPQRKGNLKKNVFVSVVDFVITNIVCACRAQKNANNYRAAVKDKLRMEERLREVEARAERKISAAGKRVKLLKQKDASVQELKKQLHNEIVLRIAAERRCQQTEGDLAHARCVMTQEVQRSAAQQQSNEEQVNSLRELHQTAEHKLQAVTNELSQVRAEFVVQLDNLQKDNERLQGLVESQVSQREQATKERAILEDKVREFNEAAMAAKREVEVLRSKVDQALTGKNLTGLAEMVGVSPTSLKRVSQAAKRGSLTSSVLEDAGSHATANWNDHTRFLKRVEGSLTPVIKKVCAGIKFKGGKTDVGGVANMILGKLAREKSARRKLLFGSNRHPGVSTELHVLLQKFGELWRHAFRDHDRDSAARLLQLTLKAIPKRSRRVSDWLGPEYFDEVLPLERGAPIRLLKPHTQKSREVKFRNGFRNTSLIIGVITKVGAGHCEIEVRENWGMRVVVNVNGSEKVIWGAELKRCSKNTHPGEDPHQARSYHKRNRKILKDVKVNHNPNLNL